MTCGFIGSLTHYLSYRHAYKHITCNNVTEINTNCTCSPYPQRNLNFCNMHTLRFESCLVVCIITLKQLIGDLTCTVPMPSIINKNCINMNY